MSRAELAAAANVPEDAIVFWIRRGLLKSETSEPRKHHRYRESEARLAAILGELRLHGLNVSSLQKISSHLRQCVEELAKLPGSRWQTLDRLQDDPSVEQSIIERIYVGYALQRGDDLLSFIRVDDGSLVVRAGPLTERLSGPSALVLDLSRVLANFDDRCGSTE